MCINCMRALNPIAVCRSRQNAIHYKCVASLMAAAARYRAQRKHTAPSSIHLVANTHTQTIGDMRTVCGRGTRVGSGRGMGSEHRQYHQFMNYALQNF